MFRFLFFFFFVFLSQFLCVFGVDVSLSNIFFFSHFLFFFSSFDGFVLLPPLLPPPLPLLPLLSPRISTAHAQAVLGEQFLWEHYVETLACSAVVWRC